MAYMLSLDELKQKFGELSFHIIVQLGNRRATCVRQVVTDTVIAYSTVLFHDAGISAFDEDIHQRIVSGDPLGRTILDSGVPHERITHEYVLTKMNFGLQFIFDTKEVICVTRDIEYMIKGVLYATVTEYYNPQHISPEQSEYGSGEATTASSVAATDWYLIDIMKAGYEEQYLRLAHGFLKKPMHVGIENQDAFVTATRETVELLMQDTNTFLFVAANALECIGYVAINIHPALHVNGYECAIRELYVKEVYQGRDIGTALMEYVERFALKKGCARMSLATNWSDDKQRGFYEHVGFERRCDFAIKRFNKS